MKTDKELQHDVLEQLEWEPSINATQIGVAVKSGVVTLTGSVPTYAQKERAEHETKVVHGVRGVANEIAIKISDILQRDDTDIATAAVEALRWDTSVPDDHIQVSVSKGWVTLEGNLKWQFQRTTAENNVRRLAGVRGVTNSIKLKAPVTSSDIKKKIEAVFRRNAELDARRVDVTAHDGKVVLHGNVRSWAERDQAQKAAWAAPGVVQVDNQLCVTP
ncbi:MAG: BON domain-containing protein [Pirellula sp.]